MTAVDRHRNPCLLALVALAGCGRNAAKAPPWLLAIDLVDVGQVLSSDAVERAVTVTNTDEQALHVDSVSASCSCLTATLDPMTIAPGATATLTIAYDPTGTAGVREHHVELHFAEPGVQPAIVRFRAEVELVFGWQGGPVDLGRVDPWVETSATVRLQGRPGAGDAEPRAASSAGELQADAQREAGGDILVDLRLTEPPLGTLDELVIVTIGESPDDRALIPVHAEVVPTIEVSRTTAFFGFVPCGEPAECVIDLRGVTPEAVERVESTAAGVTAALEPIDGGARLRLTLDPPAAGAGPLSGEVRVLMRRPERRALRFRLVGSVLPDPGCGC